MQGLGLPAELLAVHMHLAWARCQVPQVQVWVRLPAVGEGPLLSHLLRQVSRIRVAGLAECVLAWRYRWSTGQVYRVRMASLGWESQQGVWKRGGLGDAELHAGGWCAAYAVWSVGVGAHAVSGPWVCNILLLLFCSTAQSICQHIPGLRG